jgi:transposase
MAVIGFSSAGRGALEAIVARPKDVRPYRRAQALLWLDEGERPATVARRLRVHRDTIDAWAARYRQRGPQGVPARLMDRARAGRPRRLAERVERVLVTVLETAPQSQGYRAAQWTTPVLCQYVREQQALGVSEVTVRRCLHRLGYRWKRPRYILARRSRYWRQAKGAQARLKGSTSDGRAHVGRDLHLGDTSLARRRGQGRGPGGGAHHRQPCQTGHPWRAQRHDRPCRTPDF